MMYIFSSLIFLLAGEQLVAGHRAIVKAVGDQGGTRMALGSMYSMKYVPSYFWADHGTSVDLTHLHLVTA